VNVEETVDSNGQKITKRAKDIIDSDGNRVRIEEIIDANGNKIIKSIKQVIDADGN
jgi:golgin subfamily A member 4